MKNCARCHISFPLSSFGKKGKGIQPYCIECNKAQKREWYQRNKEYVIKRSMERSAVYKDSRRRMVWDYLSSHPCVDCGESDPVVLEFDHVRGKKVASVNVMVAAGRGERAILEEIAKCVVRCRNCHKRVTASRGNYWYNDR